MTTKPSTIRDIKQNSDILNVIFDFAGKWNTQIPCVSRAWKGGFEKHLFTLWHTLENISDPDLHNKVRLAKERNAPGASLRMLFKDVREQLRETLPPPSEEPVVVAPPLPSDFKSLVKRTMCACSCCFAKREEPRNRVTTQPVGVQGIVSFFVEKQKAINNYNYNLIDSRPYPDRSMNAVVNIDIKLFINGWKYDKGLFLDYTQLTELPVLIAKMRVKALALNNTYLCTLPLEIMENLFLRRISLDHAVYHKLPKKLRGHLERQVSLGRCKFENHREANTYWLKYAQTRPMALYQSGGVVSPYQNRPGVISIAATEPMGPTLFYDEMSYHAVSPLGKFYQAAYENKPIKEMEELFNRLPENYRKGFLLRVIFVSNSSLSFRDTGLICKTVSDLMNTHVESDSEGLFAIVRQLGKNQSPKDPFWSDDDGDWGKTHCLVNKGRLADALMYLESGAPIPSKPLDDEKKSD